MEAAPASALQGLGGAPYAGALPPRERSRQAARTGVLLFLASEAMFFAGLVSAAIVLRAADPGWAADRSRLALAPGIAGTVLLLASSLVASIAIGRARSGELRAQDGTQRAPAGASSARPHLRAALTLAAVLGIAFLGLQAFEYRTLFASGLTWRSSVFGSAFFVLTGLHGLHVLGGVGWLGSVALFDAGADERLHRAELAAWYWHLVDGVWLVLFTLFYLL